MCLLSHLILLSEISVIIFFFSFQSPLLRLLYQHFRKWSFHWLIEFVCIEFRKQAVFYHSSDSLCIICSSFFFFSSFSCCKESTSFASHISIQNTGTCIVFFKCKGSCLFFLNCFQKATTFQNTILSIWKVLILFHL